MMRLLLILVIVIVVCLTINKLLGRDTIAKELFNETNNNKDMMLEITTNKCC